MTCIESSRNLFLASSRYRRHLASTSHNIRESADNQPSRELTSHIALTAMSASPPPSPSQHATAHAYASNGLEILQAASDAAQAIQNHHPLQNAAAEAVAQSHAVGVPIAPAPELRMPSPQLQQQQHLVAGPGGVMRDPTINPKLTRLRRACDMCSMRKVKCDDANMPCRPCRELGVDCTFNRETKRRGPPNKHAEAAKAAKRSRIETAVVPPGFPSSPSPRMLPRRS